MKVFILYLFFRTAGPEIVASQTYNYDALNAFAKQSTSSNVKLVNANQESEMEQGGNAEMTQEQEGGESGGREDNTDIDSEDEGGITSGRTGKEESISGKLAMEESDMNRRDKVEGDDHDEMKQDSKENAEQEEEGSISSQPVARPRIAKRNKAQKDGEEEEVEEEEGSVSSQPAGKKRRLLRRG